MRILQRLSSDKQREFPAVILSAVCGIGSVREGIQIILIMLRLQGHISLIIWIPEEDTEGLSYVKNR